MTKNMPSGVTNGSGYQVPTGEALLPFSERYSECFNRVDFMFDHGLAYHPLFQIPALLQLAERIPKYTHFVYWQNGKINVGDKWETNPAPRLSLEETISGIATNNSLVILKHAEQDPVYGPLLQEILQRIFSFTSPESQDDIVLGESLIFMNSPGRKTAYHMDLESNFLLQICGEKLVHVFSCTDRTLTTDLELEDQCGGNLGAARYKPEREKDAHFHRLTPGHGLHFPSLGPHWVQNGEELSISININYDLKSIHQRLRRIYRVNRRLRKFGLTPASPGRSPIADVIKDRVSAAASTALTAVRSLKGKPKENSYPAWRPIRSGIAAAAK